MGAALMTQPGRRLCDAKDAAAEEAHDSPSQQGMDQSNKGQES